MRSGLVGSAMLLAALAAHAEKLSFFAVKVKPESIAEFEQSAKALSKLHCRKTNLERTYICVHDPRGTVFERDVELVQNAEVLRKHRSQEPSANPCSPTSASPGTGLEGAAQNTTVLAGAMAQADSVEYPQAGFPLVAGADALIGEKGDVSCTEFQTSGKSGNSWQGQVPAVQCTYNLNRALQFGAGTGGVLYSHVPHQPGVSDIGDESIGLKYLTFQAADRSVSVSVGGAVTVNTPGSHAAADGLTTAGPVLSPNVVVTKKLNDAFELSTYGSANYARGKFGYNALGTVLTYDYDPTNTIYAEGDLDIQNAHNLVSIVGFGIAHQLTPRWSLGVGVTKSVYARNNPPQTSMILGVSYSFNVNDLK